MREHESAERIKRVSMKLFNDKGYEATTIRDICNEIGITAPSFYYYFDSKELLYLQMIKECEALHQAVITEAIDNCPSQIAEDRLKYIFEALLKFYRDHPDPYTFLLRNTLFPVASMKEKIREMSNIWKVQFSEQIAGFVESSQKRRMPKLEAAGLIKSYHRFIVGYVLQLVNGLLEPTDDAAEEAWNLYWNGIK
ncbi:TetR/AcrR family transcriptional regulator [Anoxynatronum buryatiense]|uniref:Transcriptional regulator, TetR family n=1 Tax=Anoxynatronum buryatiense TaxID=489973 RepID=A0AA46AJ99_9CLOT|nr:TetR/AcrR family transcriptional regulator [Anoxynatronum buryatiense]SMP59863.1 transcriptional regulator, TetR family [Anoxynatronum buryatiense]